MTTEDDLRGRLAALLDGVPQRQAAQAVERLIEGYRGEGAVRAPALRDRADVAAYAAYRMPATFQAVCAALAALRLAAPAWVPGSHVDVGGGTGAAVWAADDAWPEAQRTTVVLDRAEPALAVGRELADGARSAALRGAEWRRQAIGGSDGPREALRDGLPEADLVTVSYVLGELAGPDRDRLVTAAAAAAQAVVIVEPGTPDGYRRVIAARDQLTGAGLTVLAPCPHSAPCPMSGTRDWCHFAARVQRSSLHRRVKGGTLPYEDEKYSYVAATRLPGGEPAAARVVRHPQIRKGQVLLELCTADDGLARQTVSKRQGPRYRAARGAAWGDAWPPPEAAPPAEPD